MHCRFSRRWFTLVELVVVLSVLLVFLALVLPSLHVARSRSLQAKCMANVRDISLAIQLYHNDHVMYPAWERLSVALEPYRNGPLSEGWSCPKTGDPYDLFYVPRAVGEEMDARDPPSDNYFIGCPCHRVVNFAGGKGTNTYSFGWVKHNGTEVPCGSEVEGGELVFADGSRATIEGRVLILTSFERANGGIYTILKVFRDYGDTKVHVTVPSSVDRRSKLEVVTPAGIAGVVGTEFSIFYEAEFEGESATLQVISGSVDLTAPQEKRLRVVPGQGSVRRRGPQRPIGSLPPGLARR